MRSMASQPSAETASSRLQNAWAPVAFAMASATKVMLEMSGDAIGGPIMQLAVAGLFGAVLYAVMIVPVEWTLLKDLVQSIRRSRLAKA